MHTRCRARAAAVLVVLAGAACGGSGGGQTVTPTSISGTVAGAGSMVTVLRVEDSKGALVGVTRTDLAGRYAIQLPREGTYQVHPQLTGYAFAPERLTVIAAAPGASGQDFQATATGPLQSLSGSVTGAAVEGVLISLYPSVAERFEPAAQGLVDGSGHYLLTGVPTGSYIAVPTLAGFEFDCQYAVTPGPVEAAFVSSPCASGSWCRTDVTLGRALGALWGSSPHDVWASFGLGGVLHWNGTSWDASWSAPNGAMTDGVDALWGSGPDDVWAVGEFGVAVHWDGASWSSRSDPSGASEPLEGLWGSGSSDVWAVGLRGGIYHWDGRSWRPSPHLSTPGHSGGLAAVWGSGPRDVWAVGAQGTVQHYDGAAWQLVDIGTGEDLLGVWGPGPGELWIAASRTLYHLAGGVWTSTSLGYASSLTGSFWGSASDDVWAVGAPGILHWDGVQWTVVDATALVGHVWGSGPGDVWAVGGEIFHRGT